MIILIVSKEKITIVDNGLNKCAIVMGLNESGALCALDESGLIHSLTPDGNSFDIMTGLVTAKK